MAFDMHRSIVLKSYPKSQTHIDVRMPPPDPYLAAARQAAAGKAFYERMDDLAAEHTAIRSSTQHNAKIAALWSTMQSMSYDTKDLSAAVPVGGGDPGLAHMYKRKAKFTSTFQEPGGSFRMFQDSSLGSMKRQERVKAMHEEKRAKILAERQARIQAMIQEKEAKLLARQQAREGRRMEEARQQHAAAKIQAGYRGMTTRRHIREYKEHQRHYGAYRMQRCYRHHAERREAYGELQRRRVKRKTDRAARTMQKCGRNYVGRRQAAPIIEERRKALEAEYARLQQALEDEAAAHIQALYRGQKGRERARDVEAQQRKDAVLKAQQDRLNAKVEQELRRAGAGPRGAQSPEIGRPFGLTGAGPRSPSPGGGAARGGARPSSRSKK